MPYERTTKRNPQQLTIDQHFHTAHAISKFYDGSEKVQVKLMASQQIVERHKRAKLFCTKRTWDERAEKGYMVAIEDDFHCQIDDVKSFSDRSHEALSKYFLLWRLRFAYHTSQPQDSMLNGIAGSDLTKSEEEVLESKGVIFCRECGALPSRFSTSLQIQVELDRLWAFYKDLKWGLLEAEDGEFLVADSYDDLAFMPIAPNLAFAVGFEDQKISREKVAEFNKLSVSKATEYFFGRDLTQCPIA